MKGIGLDPVMAERVFDLFAQAHTGLDRAKGGLGIGLSLAQRLTELHGGRIRVHSEGLGHGAEFVVTLPTARLPSSAASRRPGARGGRVGAVGADDGAARRRQHRRHAGAAICCSRTPASPS